MSVKEQVDAAKKGLKAFLRFIRLADLGYTAEHCRYAFQMAVAISIALVFVVVEPLYDAMDEQSYWTAVTTGKAVCSSAMLSPCSCSPAPGCGHSCGP